MTPSALRQPAPQAAPAPWPRPLATWRQVCRTLCRPGLIMMGGTGLCLVVLGLGTAIVSRSSIAHTLVTFSPWLVLAGCLSTGRAASLLRSALAAGLPRRTALAAGIGVAVVHALAQAPWAALTTVLARNLPAGSEPGPLTPWAVLGWVLAALGAQVFVLTFLMLRTGGRRAPWSWALVGLIVIGIAGSVLAGAVAEGDAGSVWVRTACAFLPSTDLVLLPWSAGLTSWGWSLLLGPALAARAVLRWEPRG